MTNEITSKRILVIDGGGMRGLASLLIIDAIMKELKARTERTLLPCEVFDLICGTSVGGLISILLGRLGLDCESAINIYEAIVKKLFNKERDIWDIIADGRYPNTADFEFYAAQKIGQFTGSSDVSMRLSLEDDQDPRSHPSAKTFVTIMEDAPSYTHIISSYKRQLSASANRHWTVLETMRATIASPIYISPLSIKTDRLRQFQDAGFGGYNNPVDLAFSEWKKIWPKDRIGLVLSLGTGLRDYLPETLPTTREWNPTPPYVRKFCGDVFRGRLRDLQKHDENELNVIYAIRQLARMAADSNLSHRQFGMGHSSFCDHYYRIDEPFGLTQFDLLDVYQAEAVKAHVNRWLETKPEYIRDIVAALGVKSKPPTIKESMKPTAPAITEVPKTMTPPAITEVPKTLTPPASMEVAKVMTPPPPPAETVKGYNRVMDQPRPTAMENYLRDFDVLFIIDDSGSMEGKRWYETQDALLEIAQYAQDLDVRSVSLRFLNSDIYDRGIQGRDAIISRFDGTMPIGGTPTGTVLDAVLNDHLDRIDRVASKPEEYSKIPPLDIIVLTDGVPTDRGTDDPARVIARAVARLRKSKYHPNTMGIQFVQIGDEPDAKKALTKLVQGDNGSIVDTVPYRGVLTSAELQRIVLGGLHPNVRALVPVSWLASDVSVST